MTHVSDHSNHHQVYTDFKCTGKCNYIKLPSQYLWDNTSLQKKKNLLLLFLALQTLADPKPKTIAIRVLGPANYVSISLYLQIIVHAGLSPPFPSAFRLQKVFQIHIFFMGWGCQPHAQPPTWRTRVSHLVWVITLTCLAWYALPVAMLPPA